MAATLAVDPAGRRRERAVLAVTTLGILLVAINGSALTVALPAMSGHFDAEPAVANWFLLAFMLTSTASILVLGRASDLLGRKHLYVVGLLAFTVLNVLCALAPNAPSFIVLRALQGVAAATTLTNTQALIADALPPARLTAGLGLNLTAASVGTVVGPTLGGVLVTHLDWRAIFLMSVPVGLAAAGLGAVHLPAGGPARAGAARFDHVGAVLSFLGLGLLLYGVNDAGAGGARGAAAVLAVMAGAAVLVAFVLVERRVPAPLVDLRLVTGRSRSFAYAATFFNSLPRAGVAVLVVLHQQIVGGRTAAEGGVVVAAFALSMMVGAGVSGRVAVRMPARALSTIGSTLLLAGMAGVLAVIVLDASSAPTAGALVVAGLGAGLFTPTITASLMTGVGEHQRAVANGVRAMLFNLGAATGTVTTLVLVTSTFVGGAGYATAAASAGVEQGFVLAAAALALSAAAALGLSATRGGPWRRDLAA